MAEGRSRLLLLEHRVAPRAMAAFGKAGRRTRRRNGRIRHGIVAERLDLAGSGRVAARARRHLNARFRTSRRSRLRILIIMTERRDGLEL